ncbi:hypothetical protein CINS5915_07495 [Campylobacter insulaenigrae]|uniref:hypothetical protein n=1 Tax=Campylobacter insulaenigrae TaxID=260714 RepID=UPI0021531225|nr:hypothetical protein [Campylobacter insulaenigrae]MCR6576201.1 hypothetical protein [Campylobacter insulaenigrae]MCR6579308.1 hypothetical protein [Campylobacter insulaenigrae]MCR6588465.1 hypothetical protein [Campylobacter insulaenigrae]
MNHEIRFCKDNEYELLKNYIKTQWKQDHIFVKSKTVLDFQHFDTNHQRYNFLVAYNTNTKEFDGILGFILQSQYDINFKDINVWTSLWSAKKQYPSLGLKLYKHLVDVLNIKHTSSAGMSEFSQKFVSLFGYNKIDKLYNFYIKNDKKKNFKLANFSNNIHKYKKNNSINIKKLTIGELKKSKLKFIFFPKKSLNYFINRYLRHPIYKYEAFGVFKNEELKAVFFTRTIKHNKSKCMLIVDFLGNIKTNLYYEFQSLLNKKNCEFVSLICYIPNKHFFINMGFNLKTKKEIIPVYYEPFIKENIDIYFAIKSKNKNYAIFKGDSDQDRVNQLNF